LFVGVQSPLYFYIFILHLFENSVIGRKQMMSATGGYLEKVAG